MPRRESWEKSTIAHLVELGHLEEVGQVDHLLQLVGLVQALRNLEHAQGEIPGREGDERLDQDLFWWYNL